MILFTLLTYFLSCYYSYFSGSKLSLPAPGEVPNALLTLRVVFALSNCYGSDLVPSTGGEYGFGILNRTQFILSITPLCYHTSPISVKIPSILNHCSFCPSSRLIPSEPHHCNHDHTHDADGPQQDDKSNDHSHSHNHNHTFNSDFSCSFEEAPYYVKSSDIRKVYSNYSFSILNRCFDGICTCFNNTYQTREYNNINFNNNISVLKNATFAN